MDTDNQIPQDKDKLQEKNSISIPAAIITGAVIIALAVVFTLRPPTNSGTAKSPSLDGTNPQNIDPSVLTIRENDHVLGNTQAKIVVFEYSDGDCPFCERFHPTMKQLVSQSNGSIAWVYRHFPLSIHPNALNEAVALECVASIGGNDAFWEYLDLTISRTFETSDREGLINLAMNLGLNRNEFSRCITTNAVAEIVRGQAEEAQKIGARGTPFSVIINRSNGKHVTVPGAYPIEELKRMVETIN